MKSYFFLYFPPGMENSTGKTKMTAAERKRKQRAKAKANMTEEEKQTFKEKESKRRSQLRRVQLAKMTKEERSNFRTKEVARVTASRKQKQIDIQKAPLQVKLPLPRKNPYKSRQSFGKAMNRCRIELPHSPRKRTAVVSGLAKEVGLSIQNNYEKQCYGNRTMSEELKEAIKEFYFRSDISYTMPGMKDQITIWDEFGKQHLQKHYLTMYIREAYAVFKATRPENEEMCSLSKFYKLRPKNVLLLDDIPEDTCKCQTHENLFLKLEAMGDSYEGSFWTQVLCDTTENSDCWLSKCEECKDGKKFVPKLPMDQMTNYKQWKIVLVPSKKHNANEIDENGEPKLFQKLQIVSTEVAVGEVHEEFRDQFEGVAAHVNHKRVQAAEFQKDISDPNVRVVQIDYAMAYQCQQQREIQSALWSRGSVNLFTCAVYFAKQTKTFLICSNYKGKDKFSNGVFLEHIYEKELSHDRDFKEVIWSDGPTSEFKNKFMRHLIEKLSLKYNKTFTWKFSATSHGKGVVDGIGGKVKSTVRRKVMSQGKNRILVQDAKSFADAASKLMTSTKIIHIDEEAITDYKENSPFDNAIDVKGITKIHMMEVNGEKLSFWENCAFKSSQQPAKIVLTKNDVGSIASESDEGSMESESDENEAIEKDAVGNSNLTLVPVPYDEIANGAWVIVLYEGEKWLANVVNKKENKVFVRCLEKPFGVNQPQDLEHENDSILVEEVYHSNTTPTLTQIGPDGKKGRKWFWKY